MSKTRASEFEKQLYIGIPISERMNAKILKISDDHVEVGAPIAPNQNHKKTAFGGSVYSIAVLSCWALVSETVREKGLKSDYIMIQDGQMKYLQPLESDFTAKSSWESDAARQKFLLTLAKKGLARATVSASVFVGSKKCATFTGRFVARIVST